MRNNRQHQWILSALFLALTALLPQGAVASVRIGVSDWPGWVAWYIADRNGYFARHGARVELLWFESYSDSVKALTEGALDANSQSWGDTLPLLAAGHELQLILINDTSDGNDALLVAPAINDIGQLRGKRIALELDSPSHLLLDAALQQRGLSMQDVELVNMPAADAASALNKGLVDGAVTWNPWIDTALQGGKARVLFDSSQLPGLITDALVARSERLQSAEQRQEFIGVMQAWFDTVAFIRENPVAAAAIMAEASYVDPLKYRTLLPSTRFFGAAENLTSLTAKTDRQSLYHSTQQILDYLSRHGVITEPLDFQRAINQELVRAAAKPFAK
jgi:NitT/TauT family transport system substrate-binding protein